MIERARQTIEFRRDWRGLVQHGDGAAGRFRIQGTGIVHQRRRHADARRKRQAPGKPMIQAVDGLHVQTRGIVFETPVPLAAARERRPSMTMQRLVMRLRAERKWQGRFPERLDNAVVHLGRGLACECDCNDLLRALDLCEKAKESQRQQARLSRTGRGLHDVRA